MRISKLSFVPVLLALVSANAAQADEMVEFSLKESELATTEKREKLLDRMARYSAQTCRDTMVLAMRSNIEECAIDLQTQFVKAIDDDALTLMAESRMDKTYRSASR